jgi:hypothetical protein
MEGDTRDVQRAWRFREWRRVMHCINMRQMREHLATFIDCDSREDSAEEHDAALAAA